jgi:hypothetical protein
MSLSPEEAGCPIRDDHWPRWLKMRDGAVIWFYGVVGWDGEWIRIDEVESTGWDKGEGETTVNDWIDYALPLRATSIRWSEVVAHGEVQG